MANSNAAEIQESALRAAVAATYPNAVVHEALSVFHTHDAVLVWYWWDIATAVFECSYEVGGRATLPGKDLGTTVEAALAALGGLL